MASITAMKPPSRSPTFLRVVLLDSSRPLPADCNQSHLYAARLPAISSINSRMAVTRAHVGMSLVVPTIQSRTEWMKFTRVSASLFLVVPGHGAPVRSLALRVSGRHLGRFPTARGHQRRQFDAALHQVLGHAHAAAVARKPFA